MLAIWICSANGCAKNGLLVDAILGTGMKNASRGLFADAITLMNASGLPIVAVDIPSGMDSDTGHAAGRGDSSRDDGVTRLSEAWRSDSSRTSLSR